MVSNYLSTAPLSCKGVVSKTADDKHCVMVDFDGVPIKIIRKGIHAAQEIFHHGDYIIIAGKKRAHYHLYCPTKVTTDEYLKVLNHFIKLGADENFKIPLTRWERKGTILRFHGKSDLKVAEIIQSPYRNEREVSNAHLIFLRKIYGVNTAVYHNRDGYSRLIIDSYHTFKT